MNNLDYSLTEKGLKIKYTKKCDFCKFSNIDLLSGSLICSIKYYLIVEKESVCDKFKISKQLKQQIIQSCKTEIKKGDLS